jgi:hypothetical protein
VGEPGLRLAQLAAEIGLPSSHPYFRYVQKAFEIGLLGPCSPGMFCPDAAMTRGDVAGPLVRALVDRN